jgi:pimeloyl-ACP methyl ester carboxylesterase
MAKIIRAALILLVILLAAVLVGPFLVPVPRLQGTVPPEQLADPDSRFVEINGLRVHYKTAGSGEPYLILLHGFGASLYSWHAVMEPLGQMGTVIAYDRPAFGLTERPLSWTGINPYGPEANGDLLLGLMDHFQIRQVILVGNSAGGTVAMNFALAHPDRVQALILVDPAVFTSGGLPGWAQPLLNTPQMNHLGPWIARQIKGSGPELLRTAWHDPSKITSDVLEGYTKPLRAENWDKALWFFTVASRDSGLTRHLSEFRMPVWIITGDDDRVVPTAQTRQLAGEMPGAVLFEIKDAGHVPQEEQPEIFLTDVSGFLKTLRCC